jgi:hypothetical protein
MQAADESTSVDSQDDFDAELRAFEKKLAFSSDAQAAVQKLIDVMSPASHHTPAGLAATRIFSALCA